MAENLNTLTQPGRALQGHDFTGLSLSPSVRRELVRVFEPGNTAAIAAAYAGANNQLSADGATARAQIAEAFNSASRNYTGNLINLAAQVRAQLSTSGAMPSRDGEVISTYYEGTDQPIDTSWVQLFDVRDFRNTQEEDFEILNIRDGISFRAYNAGERVELYGVSGDLQKFPFQRMGAGFQWEQTWVDDSKLWRIEDGITSAQTKYGLDQSRTAYEVLTNPTGIISQTRITTGSTVIENDVLTVNAAMTAILADMYDHDGYVDPSPRFFILFNNLTQGYGGRIAAMLAAQYGIAHPTLGNVALQYALTPLGSPHIPVGDFKIVYAGRKLKSGIRMDQTMFAEFDPYTYTGARIFWGRYTHVRGDSRQIRSVPLA